MTMKSLYLSLLMFCVNFGYSQTYYRSDLAKMVVAIGDRHLLGTRVSGTGVIIRDSSKYYLVTAAHVSDSIKGECVLIFSAQGNVAVPIPLKSFTSSVDARWKNHFEADVSYIQIKPFSTDTENRLKMYSFPKNQVFCKMEPVSLDSDVLVIGFPMIDVIGLRFSPFVFNSQFAGELISLPRADTRKSCVFQALQNPSVQGYSGGPVLVGFKRDGVTTGPNVTALVGIMHGNHSDNTGGKMAMVTPSVYLCDLIK